MQTNVTITAKGTVVIVQDYYAPHKLRGTQRRLHKSRKGLPLRLFKGHRP